MGQSDAMLSCVFLGSIPFRGDFVGKKGFRYDANCDIVDFREGLIELVFRL